MERINGWLYQKAILNEQQTVRRRIMLRSQRDRARVAAEAVRARNRDAKVAEEKEDWKAKVIIWVQWFQYSPSVCECSESVWGFFYYYNFV